MNILIYPSPADVGKVEGLCGNFNGEYLDDLYHRDGTNDPVVYEEYVYEYYGWTWTFSYLPDPDEFSRSWG